MHTKEQLLERIMSLTTDVPWRESIRLSRESLKGISEKANLGRIKHVYLTGGGTSLYAAEVGKAYIEKIAGVHAEAVPCYWFSRYMPAALLGPDVLLVGISQTGTALSVAESVAAAQKAGALDIAVSGYYDRPVPAAARHVIMTDAAYEGPTVKSISYVQALVAVYLLALEIGKANGNLNSDGAAYWDDQLELAVVKSAELASLVNQVYDLAGIYKDAPIHHVLATGPNVGTVEEGALKIIEMAWVPSEGRELEDFLHGRFRIVDSTTPLLLLAPKGPVRSKLLDTLGAASHINAPTIVFTDDDDPLIARMAKHVVKMPGGLDEYVTSMVYITPLWMYGHRLGILRGTDPAGNRHGFVPTAYNFYQHFDGDGKLIKPVI